MDKPIIYLGADHNGFELKNQIGDFLKKKGYRIYDLGPFKYDKNDDYPDYAIKVCKKILKNKSKGILICGTGQGMSRAANKVKGIVAEVCWNQKSARHAKEHSNANVLSFGSTMVSSILAKKMVMIWLSSEFNKEKRHIRRYKKIIKIENRNI